MEPDLLRIRRLIVENDDIAFVVGNGINRFENLDPDGCSWDSLVSSLWSLLSSNPLPNTSYNGISLTELYDIINLCAVDDGVLIDNVLDFVSRIPETQYHKDLQTFFIRRNRPVLTTNFDTRLETGLEKRKLKESTGFSSYYPWNVYYSDHDLISPTSGFGVWHINGSVNYKRSMKLGLTQYMNTASRIKGFLHSGEVDDFNGKNRNMWRGSTTWLHIVFNCTLIVFGLSLDVNETLLRWLLIERQKYYEKYPDRRRYGYYITTKDMMKKEDAQGKRFYLEAVGLEVIELDSFEEVYRGILDNMMI